ncbi:MULTISPECIES: phosphoribosylaminoimidazolesuccinocarboxamide synthase [unclassified Actinomyces]|uniref:phosphoribosylaminoimidazolesuccinocarboxamide synthase n=1 Tax=unclassified Actinomyces TaxID=2609248 RepID=UPI000D5917DF|nr:MULTISPECIES: phosphoribosylaminoimidazolesuccinocarboxamide synthase [unclassified Actinomyces]RAX23697.1 phosphoribosylaminoimidazolesuccinocarboxamide synthase [Actinomyces sp. Z3]
MSVTSSPDVAAPPGAAQSSAPALPGWKHVSSGKVRDVYAPAEVGPWSGQDVLLLVASDRISAYDHILSTPVPDKGKVLTALSVWWFEQLADIVPGHVVSLDVPAAVAGRAMICRRLKMYPVECVARGYLTGSGLVEYRESGTVCGLPLPAGLTEASRLPEPIFTPAAKAELGEHDENVSFERVVEMVGREAAEALRETTLALYSRAADIARERGIILADTKFEFGQDPATGALILGDEVLTPDSSRFWPADAWTPGRPTPSFDKQYVRDWLTSPASGWDRGSNAAPPALPDDVVQRTRQRYLEAYERLTGSPLELA